MESVCPVCLRRVEAQAVNEGDRVYMEKTCPDHGEFKVLLWNGPGYAEWAQPRPAVEMTYCHTPIDKGCPYDCGICPDHRQRTCCVLLEITQRCNLLCPVCFASSREESDDPSIEEIGEWFDMLMDSGGPFNIQLSGGEPTVRDDVPEIIRLGKSKGFSFFQLNTNGIRLAHDAGYASKLKEAGLDCVFLQFDSMGNEIYVKLRGRELRSDKLAAIDNCAAAGLGVVLVPTIAAGVNEEDIGAILDFAVERMPAIRGVHFQPMSYFGRYPGNPEGRVTIPDMLRHIEKQTKGRMKAGDFNPGAAENAYCSFNCSYLLRPDGSLQAFEKPEQSCCCGSSDKSREFVAKHWSAAPEGCCGVERDTEPTSFDEFLERTQQYTLAVSGMVFQDAWNLDLDRLRSCYIHIVSSDKRVIPFCAYNLTGAKGQALYRGVKN